MKCNNCGFIMKVNRKYCKKCGVNIEEFNRINNYETEYKTNKYDILLSIFVPIKGFISWFNSKRKKVIILLSSIFGTFIYIGLITLLLTSLFIRNEKIYTFSEDGAELTIKLKEEDETGGTFKVSGYSKINYHEIVYDYFLGQVMGDTHIVLNSKFRYSGQGFWVKKKKENVLELWFLKETMKLEIYDDYGSTIKETYYEIYLPIIGEEKTNDLIDGKRVVLTYDPYTVGEYILINDTNQSFEFYKYPRL